jgi:serine/threonine-protein kinase
MVETQKTQQILEKLGDFAIRSLLGEGGSGIVYAAVRGDDRVALKVLRADLALSERERRRFMEEVERMRRLDHPGLVSVLDAGILPDGRPYLAMPLLEGEPLASRLTRGALPADEALATFDALAEAVQALHDAGLIHRDIKPENVFVPAGGGRAILLDLGIARDASSEASTTTQAGVVRGTPAYMAPERFFGTPASVASDVYELAVVLYAMLVGHLPWDMTKSAEARLAPLHPRDYGVTLPGALATVLMRAISTRPEARPGSARELAHEVRASLTATEIDVSSRRTADAHPVAPARTPAPRAFEEATTGSSTAWAEPTQKRKVSSVAWIVAGCAIAAGVGGVWFIGKKPSAEVAGAQPSITQALAVSSPSPSPSTTTSTTATATPTATPTPTPTANPTANPTAIARAAAKRDAGVAPSFDPDRFYQDRK